MIESIMEFTPQKVNKKLHQMMKHKETPRSKLLDRMNNISLFSFIIYLQKKRNNFCSLSYRVPKSVNFAALSFVFLSDNQIANLNSIKLPSLYSLLIKIIAQNKLPKMIILSCLRSKKIIIIFYKKCKIIIILALNVHYINFMLHIYNNYITSYILYIL